MSIAADLSKYLRIYEDKAFLIKEGDMDSEFYCLVSGVVSIWKGDPAEEAAMVKVGEISEKGGYFGEMSHLLAEPRTASIKASGDVKVLRFPGNMLHELMKRQPTLGIKLCTMLADRLKGTTTKTEDIAEERNAIREGANEQYVRSKEVFQKVFACLMAIQKQSNNAFVRDLIDYMHSDKMLQGRHQRIDEDFCRSLPKTLAELLLKTMKDVTAA